LEISERIRIDRPRAEVFAAWSSLERWPEYADGVLERTKLTPGAAGKGARFRAADRWPGWTVRFGVEITAFEPPERIAATWSDPMSGGCDAIFEDVEGGTEMRYDASLDPSGVVGLLLPLLRPWVRRRAKAQLRGFRAWVESGDAVAARRPGAGP
jgi:uncharacterized membrane protein